MATAALSAFRDVVLKDAELQQRLLATTGRAAFVDLLTRLARERGFVITSESIDEALSERRREWLERWV